MSKKVSELTEITKADNNVYLLTDNGNINNKITKGNLLSDVKLKVNVKEFGAKGDGATDDTQAIQNAIEYAKTNGINNVYLEGKEYLVSDSVKVPSRFVLEGLKGQSVIKMNAGVDKPVIEHTGNIAGETIIMNITIKGNGDKENNHGIYINDYYSQIKNVEISNCGGCGIKWHFDGASGTLVENRIENVKVKGCAGTSFDLGTNNNNKITDGFLINCISSGTASSQAVKIGSSAGWIINGLHTYGHKLCNKVVEVNNAYSTLIDNVYIEAFTGTAIHTGSVQNNLNISNITVRVKSDIDTTNPNNIVYYTHSGSFDYPSNIVIQNIAVENNNTGTTYVINGDGGSARVKVSNLNLSGTQKDLTLLTRNKEEVRNSVFLFDTVHEKANTVGLHYKNNDNYDAFSIPLVQQKSIVAKGAQTLTFSIPQINKSTMRFFRLNIIIIKGDNIDKLKMQYFADGVIARSEEGYTIHTITKGTPEGFATDGEPVVTYDGVNTLTVSYTPEDSSSWQFGRVVFEYLF